MFHGLDNRFLYSAYQISCTFANDDGAQVNCTGTGFWVRSSDSPLILVTNRHVVDLEYTNPRYAGYKLHNMTVSGKAQEETSGLPNIDQTFVVYHSGLKFSKTRENDIACLTVRSVVSLDGSPNTKIDYFIDRELLATKADFDTQFSVCDFVAFPGFPEWYDKRQRRPILRTGTISSDTRYDYSWSSDYKGECIAYEAFSYGGSSGSPVFAVQKGPKPGKGISFPGFRALKLVGINAGHLFVDRDNNTHSGISYMYKASAILDIIDTGSVTKPKS